MTEVPPPPVPGFTLQRRVSRGDGPTDVWEAVDADGHRTALKLLVPSRAAPDQVLRFVREGEFLRRLADHPGIVRLKRQLTEPPAMVLDWAAGGTLRDRIHPGGYGARATPLAPALVRRIGIDLCDTLGWLHERGAYHRDVKPANVLLDAAGRPLLGDFGIAACGDPPRAVPEGWVEEDAGTLGYAAPELLRDPSAVGPAIDVYGLGATLYEALTGRLPHDMQPHDTERSLRWRLARGEAPVPLATRGWRGSGPLGAAIERALAAEPAARYPTMAALRADLD